MSCYQWLICWLLKETDSKIRDEMSKGKSKFTARCNTQVYRASTMTRAYSEYIVLMYYGQVVNRAETSLQPVLKNLFILYGLSSLDKHLTVLYQGGYATGSELADMVRSGILEVCARVKPDAVAVVDALAPPDFVLNSVLGKSDGKVIIFLHDLLSYCYFYLTYWKTPTALCWLLEFF